jgi:L-lactate dehydrogenase (cytochrome)
VLSNHGGRQLDRAPIPFHLLPDVVREVGKDTEIILDTGIMSGADIVASIALGAKFTLIGRAYLYGLMAGGREGVDRTIEILSSQLIRTMRLLGVNSLAELTPAHVTQLQRLVPIPRPMADAAEAVAARPVRASRTPSKIAAAEVAATSTAKAAGVRTAASKKAASGAAASVKKVASKQASTTPTPTVKAAKAAAAQPVTKKASATRKKAAPTS